MQTTPEQWAETAAQGTTITTEDLDRLVTNYRVKREVYEAMSAEKTKAYNELDEAEGALKEAMTGAGKRKYHVDGVGLVFFVEKFVVPTPKNLDQKRKFFDYINQTYGETFLMDKLSIHHQVLQKLYNDAFEEAKEQGKGAEFHIPGLEQPTSQVSLNFRKETK